MIDSTAYKFYLKSKTPGLDFTKQYQKIFKRVVIRDDIFNMYPYMEVHLNDEAGTIADDIISAEGIEFSSEYGSNTKGYEGWIKSDWVWKNNQTNDVSMTGHIGGTTGISFVHKNYAYDTPKIRAWNDKVDIIAETIVATDFDTKIAYLTPTDGKKIRRQAGMFSSEYLETLASVAYSKTYEYSPFLTFFNMKGEFYFCAIDSLFKIAKRIDEPYVIDMSQKGTSDRYTIKEMSDVGPLGLGVNINNYKIQVSKTNRGVNETEITDIVDHTLNSNKKGKILINKDLKNKYGYFSQERYGLYTKSKDAEDYKGYRNSLYLESVLNFRIHITIAFNPEAVSGRIIKLKIGSVSHKKAYKSKEYSGDWLIISSQIFYDADLVPYQVLQIAKTNVDMDSNHVFKKQMQ